MDEFQCFGIQHDPFRIRDAGMKIIRPLQLNLNTSVLEQSRQFYFISSVTMGINLLSGETHLDLDYIKDMVACMGETAFPDAGMPKPRGEYLVSAHFHAPGKVPVTGGKAKIVLAGREKEVYVFGPRKWDQGLPSPPEKILSMPLDYGKAFGGKGFEPNPDGMGYRDGLLPCVEDPARLVGSKEDKPSPAGFSPLAPMLPQRMKFQGTYGPDYKHRYFPGYPEDHDWAYFLSAPQDQWMEKFFSGNERFAIHGMHPDHPLIEGRLPGFRARCFLHETVKGQPVFRELGLNLDTLWFFPEKLLGILIFRGVTRVGDDEASGIHDVLCAYEDSSRPARSLEYYKAAFEKRRECRDALLNNLNIGDLIPEGHPSAMALLMDSAFKDDHQSELANNLDQRAKALQHMADERVKEALEKAQKETGTIHLPDGAAPDPDVEGLKKTLEDLMPGITAGDPKKMDMTHFSFDHLAKMTQAMDDFAGKKEKQAMDQAQKDIQASKNLMKDRIHEIEKQMAKASKDMADQGRLHSLEDSKQKMTQALQHLEDMGKKPSPDQPLPRIDIAAITAQAEQIDPNLTEAMQYVRSMKQMGVKDETAASLETDIQTVLASHTAQISHALKEAEQDFFAGYALGAHFMEPGLSPHNKPLEDIKQIFLSAVSQKEPVCGKDWACLDLSGMQLEGLDFNSAYLEQVNFKGAGLKGADFSHAVLARANFEDADLTGANFEGANIGAVHALRANFTGANLKSAKLSRGNFTRADFTGADLQGIEALEIIVQDADFTGAHMPKMIFIELDVSGTVFVKADLSASVFLKCRVKDADFSSSRMHRCSFVDSPLKNVKFMGADFSNGCFASGESEPPGMENLSFKRAILTQANFQGMDLKRADLSHTRLENAFLGEADLTEADLSHAQAKNAQFRKARLTRAKLDGIDLAQGSLAKAHLVGASFKGANLYAVDFLRATITQTDFSLANLDATLIEHWRPE